MMRKVAESFRAFDSHLRDPFGNNAGYKKAPVEPGLC
jgi:hypothetical protein